MRDQQQLSWRRAQSTMHSPIVSGLMVLCSGSWRRMRCCHLQSLGSRGTPGVIIMFECARRPACDARERRHPGPGGEGLELIAMCACLNRRAGDARERGHPGPGGAPLRQRPDRHRRPGLPHDWPAPVRRPVQGARAASCAVWVACMPRVCVLGGWLCHVHILHGNVGPSLQQHRRGESLYEAFGQRHMGQAWSCQTTVLATGRMVADSSACHTNWRRSLNMRHCRLSGGQ